MPNHATHAKASLQSNFRQLSRFSRACFASDDNDLSIPSSLLNFFSLFVDGQRMAEFNLWTAFVAFVAFFDGAVKLIVPSLKRLLILLVIFDFPESNEAFAQRKSIAHQRSINHRFQILQSVHRLDSA